MGQFLLQQAIRLGARPVATNSLPVIGGEWGYSEDKGKFQEGMMFRLSRERFSEVQQFLRQAFGPPRQEPVRTIDGKLGWYGSAPIGIELMFDYDSKWTEIIISRLPVPAGEIKKRPPEASRKDFQ